MLDGLRDRYHAVLRRARRFERREVAEFRRWLEHTTNLIHLSVLLLVPLLIAVVTWFSQALSVVSFLLFPPLASGTYTLFADPEGKYASPTKFVGGMTAGAVCGWVALLISANLHRVEPSQLSPHASGAALSILLTGAVTWALDLEEPTAFSTALLVLITDAAVGEIAEVTILSSTVTVGVSGAFSYVVSVALTSGFVAGVFVLWRDHFYEQRSRYLYQSTKGDDHVLVPMRGDRASSAAMFGAQLAAAHDAGKVVLLDVVDEETVKTVAETGDESDGTDDDQPELVDAETVEAEGAAAEAVQVADESAKRLEAEANRIKTRVGVPCEVVVAGDGANTASTVLKTAHETNCDLVVAPYEEQNGGLSPFVRGLFRGDVDTIAFRSAPESDGRERWKRVLVPVRRAGDTAHAMIDFARRLTGLSGSVGVCTCIDREAERRATETKLANLVETFDGSFETRVSRSSIESFLSANDSHYDLVIMGASTDRSTASRFISPPTFERLHDLECDVAVVHRA
ncbi:HPP family protein [Halorussus halophilus]|uniref:HPP family protein n=1 Tax=Halorussus halophilus TaxID=2650975 RepID=UPI0013019541|nr:HPP family protein [Halorussus halophilus]